MPRAVISDTSPIQYLHQADCLNLLPTLYDEVWIPDGVRMELAQGIALGVSLLRIETLNWIRIRSLSAEETSLPLANLGRGEREVLSLAVASPGSLAILDDGLARHIAGLLEVRFTGTLGVLLKAKQQGHLKTLRPVVEALQRSGFHLDETTREAILNLAGQQ